MTFGNPGDVDRAILTQQGMAQFERYHAPEARDNAEGNPEILCFTCGLDWPCERMVGMLVVQGLAVLQSMIPSGNMSAIIGRFAGGGR